MRAEDEELELSQFNYISQSNYTIISLARIGLTIPDKPPICYDPALLGKGGGKTKITIYLKGKFNGKFEQSVLHIFARSVQAANGLAQHFSALFNTVLTYVAWSIDIDVLCQKYFHGTHTSSQISDMAACKHL